MHEVLADQDRVEMWRQAADGILPDWDKAFEGYGATVDWPGAYFWRELSEHFPDAKILLTTRDSASWYNSMEKTILDVVRNSTDPNSIATKLLGRNVFQGEFYDRDHIIGLYEKNIADVQAAFDDDRLLTFNLGDDWEPLCQFLECPVPDEPFPHTNQPGKFHESLDELENSRKGSD